jgi:hypothetical protein
MSRYATLGTFGGGCKGGEQAHRGNKKPVHHLGVLI